MSGWRRNVKEQWAVAASVALHGAAVAAFLVQFTRPAPSLPADSEAPSLAVEVMLMPTPTPEVVNTSAPSPPPPPPEPEPEVVEEPPPLIESIAEAPPAPPPPPPPEVKKPDPEPPKPITMRVPPRPERTPPRPKAEPSPVVAPPAPPVPAPPANQTALAAPAGRAGPPPNYLTLIAAQLERNKVYPRAAQSRRQQGRARLHFAIDRDGNVLRHRILTSSGHEILDREVEALIKRVSPLPPMPSDMPQDALEMTVAIEFFLR